MCHYANIHDLQTNSIDGEYRAEISKTCRFLVRVHTLRHGFFGLLFDAVHEDFTRGNVIDQTHANARRPDLFRN